MKHFDVHAHRRNKVALMLVDELLRPGRNDFLKLPTMRFLWRAFEPIVLTKPIYRRPLQTKAEHLAIGSIGTGRVIQPAEEMIAWALQKDQLPKNPIIQKLIASAATLNRPLHILFSSYPRDLVYLTVAALVQLARERGLEQVMIHPINEYDEPLINAILKNGHVAVGSIRDINNYDALLLVNFAPHTHESWLTQLLNARPDLANVKALVLTGESGDPRVRTAFPIVHHEGSLTESVTSFELPHRRAFPAGKSPHFPYYFDGLRQTQLGVFEKPMADAEELKKQFDMLVGLPRDFSSFYISNTFIQLPSFDRLLERFAFDYLKQGGSLIIVSGIEEAASSIVSGVFVDRALQKDLVSSAMADSRSLVAAARPQGVITDIAPTILRLFGAPIPYQMTGKPLI